MKRKSSITGLRTVLNNIRRKENKMINKVATIVERTSVSMSNHAKSGHAGDRAHMNNRYQNRTTNLTNSIDPDTLEITATRINGGIATNMEYAYYVEQRYPFMFPALRSVKDEFSKNLKAIL